METPIPQCYAKDRLKCVDWTRSFAFNKAIDIKKVMSLTLLVLSSLSCSNLGRDNGGNVEIDSKSSSGKAATSDVNKIGNIHEPFEVSKIVTAEDLHFVSSAISTNESDVYCDNPLTGVYGRYKLRAQMPRFDHPFVATIDIYKPGKIEHWKASDTNQTIWSVNLETEAVSVWDSIRIGLPKHKIVQFGRSNNGLCLDKDDDRYLCDFNSYSVEFYFENDTLSKLTLMRKCAKKESSPTAPEHQSLRGSAHDHSNVAH